MGSYWDPIGLPKSLWSVGEHESAIFGGDIITTRNLIWFQRIFSYGTVCCAGLLVLLAIAYAILRCCYPTCIVAGQRGPRETVLPTLPHKHSSQAHNDQMSGPDHLIIGATQSMLLEEGAAAAAQVRAHLHSLLA